MTKSEDIVNLFQQFGGQVNDYQELSRQQSAQQAKKRWPLLSALELGQANAAQAPTVAAAESPVTTGPIEFRPAPIAPPAPVLATSGQHLSQAELAGGAPAPVPAPATVPAPAPAPAPIPVAAPAPAPISAVTPALAVTAPPAVWQAAPVAPAPAAPILATPRPAATPTPTPTPAAVAAPAAWAAPTRAPIAAPSPLAATSPLASLGHAVPATPVAPAPATELQGIFARLAGRTEAPPPPPSGLAALWQNLRGGA